MPTLARGMIAAGVQAGDRVGILSRTRYEWTLADYAIWTAGGVAVPIHETSSSEQAQWILSDSGAVAVVVETAADQELVESVRDGLPGLRDVWQIDAGDLDGVAARAGEVPEETLTERRDTLVYGKLRAAMGGKVEYALSGGAPLGGRLGHFSGASA